MKWYRVPANKRSSHVNGEAVHGEWQLRFPREEFPLATVEKVGRWVSGEYRFIWQSGIGLEFGEEISLKDAQFEARAAVVDLARRIVAAEEAAKKKRTPTP